MDGMKGIERLSRGRRAFRLTEEQLVTLPWDRLPILLTLPEAATRSRLSTWTLRQAVHGCELPAIQVGKRLLVARADLEAFLQGRRTALPAVPARARG